MVTADEVVVGFNPPFRSAMDDLMAEFEANELPEVVSHLVVAVLKKPIKLCCWVGEADLATGASRIEPGFYASDLLVELLLAVRALNWEVVVRLLEHAVLPPLEAVPGREPIADMNRG